MKSVSAVGLADGARATVTLERELIDIRLSVQPMKVDPDWRWVDPAGHVHDASLSKAHWVVLYSYWCEQCWDEHEEQELQCRYCGARVEPRRVPDYSQPDYIEGLLEGRLTVERGRVTSTYLLLRDALDRLQDGVTDEWVASAELEENLIERTVDFV